MFRIFLSFSLVGGLEGGVRGARKGGGDGLFIEIPGEGGSSRRGGGGGEAPGGCLRGVWAGGGGVVFFFRAEIPTKIHKHPKITICP